MADKTLMDVLNDLAKYIDANGKGILEDPGRFKSLFLEYSGNQYQAEARIISKFLASKYARDIKANADSLRAIARNFHEDSLYDESACEMAVGVCAWLGLVDRKALKAALGGEMLIPGKVPKNPLGLQRRRPEKPKKSLLGANAGARKSPSGA